MHAVARHGLVFGPVLLLFAPPGRIRAVAAVVGRYASLQQASTNTSDTTPAAVGQPAPDDSLPSLRPSAVEARGELQVTVAKLITEREVQ